MDGISCGSVSRYFGSDHAYKLEQEAGHITTRSDSTADGRKGVDKAMTMLFAFCEGLRLNSVLNILI